MNKKLAAAAVCGAVVLGTFGSAVGANASTTAPATSVSAQAAVAGDQVTVTSTPKYKEGTVKVLTGTGPAGSTIYAQAYLADGSLVPGTLQNAPIRADGTWSLGLTLNPAIVKVVLFSANSTNSVTVKPKAGADASLKVTVTSDKKFTPGAVKVLEGTAMAGRWIQGEVYAADGSPLAPVYAQADLNGQWKFSVVLPANAKTFEVLGADDPTVVKTQTRVAAK